MDVAICEARPKLTLASKLWAMEATLDEDAQTVFQRGRMIAIWLMILFRHDHVSSLTTY